MKNKTLSIATLLLTGALLFAGCGQTGNTGKFCGNCGSAKPAANGPWTCPSCGQAGNTGKFCSNCGQPRA